MSCHSPFSVFVTTTPQCSNEGEILFENEDLLKRPLSKMREIRGNDISVIFQDPLNSLSPVHTVGKQLSEIVLLHKNVTKSEAKARSIEMLKLTGIPNPEDCMKSTRLNFPVVCSSE